MVSFEVPPRCRPQVRLKLYITHIYMVLPNPRNWNAAWKLLVVQLQAARYRELYPLLTTLPSSFLLWWCVFPVHFCDVVLVLFCDRTDLLKWLIWRSNGFASNSASNSARWLQNHNRRRGRSWMLKAWCVRNLFHQDRWSMENSIVTFWGNWGKTSGTNVQMSDATTPGPCFVTTLQLTCRLLHGSFWLLRRWHPPLLTGPRHVIFSYSWRWNWSSRGNVMTALNRSRSNCRTWWRSCHKMTPRSASYHGNPAGIAVAVQKGTTSKETGANRNFG